MESYVIVVKGKEVPVPKLSYEDVADLIVDWRVGGVTDPLGQLIDWLWNNIKGFLETISNSLHSAIDSAVTAITSGIETIIEGAMSAITAAIDAVSSGLEALINGIVGAIEGVSTFIGSAIDSVLGFIGSIGESILNAISSVVSSVIDAISSGIATIGEVIGGIVSTITSAIGGIVNTISGILQGIANSIMSGLASLANTISGIISGIVSTITGLFSQLASALGGLASTIGSMISSAFSQLSGMISGLIDTVVSTMRDLLSGLADAISGLVSQIMDGISGLVSMISTALSEFINTVVNTISGIISDILDAITSGLTELGQMFSDAFSGVYSFFASVFEQITANLVQLGQYFTGFINAIAEFGGKIWDALSKIGEALTNFADWIAAGLSKAWEGLVKALEPVWKPVTEFFDWAYSTLGDFFTKTVPEFFTKTVPEFVDQVVKFFTGDVPEFFSSLWSGLVEFTRPIWEPLAGFFEWVYTSLSDFFTKTVPEFFTKTVPQFIDNVIKFFTGDVPAFFSSLWSGLVEFTRPIWEPVKGFFDWVYTSLSDFFTKTLPEFFTKTVPEFVDRVVKFFTGDVPAFFSSLWSGLVEFTRPIWEPIQNFFGGLWEGIQAFLEDPLGSLTKAFSDAWKTVTDALEPVLKPISDALSGLGETLGKAGERIYEFFTEDIPKFFSETLPQIGHDMWDWFVTGIQDLGERVRGFIAFLAEMFNRAIIAVRGVVESTFSPMMSEFVSKATSAAQEIAKPGSPPKEMEEFAKTLYKIQEDLLMSLKKKMRKGSPGQMLSLGDVISIGIAALALKTSIEAVGMVGDLVHPVKNMQIRKLIKSAIDYMGGFFITSAPAASMTFFVIHQALRRWLYRSFPVVLPGPEQLTRIWLRKRITEEDLNECLAELGYAEEFREGFKDLAVNLLNPRQVLLAIQRKLLDLDTGLRELEKQGYIDRDQVDRAKIVLDIERPLPTVNDLIEFWRFGKIDDEKLKEYIGWRGYHEEFIEAYYTSRLRMPSVSEMITSVVKEAMSPTAFKELLKRQGLIELDKYEQELNVKGIAAPGIATVEETMGKPKGKLTWADILWEAHWRLPPLERIIEFVNRAVVGMVHVGGKEIKLDEGAATKAVLLYSRLHDYKPVPRKHTVLVGGRAETISMPVSDAEIMEAMRFRVLTRIESRFVRRWGLISEEDFKRLLQAQGISPYVKIKTLDGKQISMIEALMHAEFLQDLLEERTFFRSAVIQAFQKGYNIKTTVFDPIEKKDVDVETLKLEDALKAVRFRSEEISWLKASANIRRIIELRDDAVKALVNDYVAGMAPLEELQKSLEGIIDDKEVRDSVIEYAIKRRAIARYKRMATRLDREMLREADTVLKLYEQGFAPRADAEKKLDELVEKKLLLQEEKDVLLSIADTRRQRELRELAVRALAKKLSRGEITIEQFKSSAKKLGVDEQFVDAMMENYATAHMLSVGQLISYADEVPIPSDVLEKKLKLLRVPEDEKKIIREVVRRRPLRDDIYSLIYTLTSMASTLDATPGDAEVLRGLGLTGPEVEIRRKVIELLNKKAVKREIRRALETMLREQYQAMAKGEDPKLITLDQFYKAMKALGYPDEYIVSRAQYIVASAAQEKLPDFEKLKTQILAGGVAA